MLFPFGICLNGRSLLGFRFLVSGSCFCLGKTLAILCQYIINCTLVSVTAPSERCHSLATYLL